MPRLCLQLAGFLAFALTVQSAPPKDELCKRENEEQPPSPSCWARDRSCEEPNGGLTKFPGCVVWCACIEGFIRESKGDPASKCVPREGRCTEYTVRPS